ncbi:MAG: hypothetical protein WBN16_11290 [Lutimonas sp.]
MKLFSSIISLFSFYSIISCTSSSVEIYELDAFDLLVSKDWILNKIDQNELKENNRSTWRWNQDGILLIEFDDVFITANWYMVFRNNSSLIIVEFIEIEIPQRIQINDLRTEFELIQIEGCLKLSSQNNVELTFC